MSVKHLSNTRSERSRRRLFTSANNGIKSGSANSSVYSNCTYTGRNFLNSRINDSYGEHYPSGSTEVDDFEDSEDHDDYENNIEDLKGSFNLSKVSKIFVFCIYLLA